MGLEYQVCYNGGAHESKYKQSRFPLIGAIAPPPPAAGGNLNKDLKKKKKNPMWRILLFYNSQPYIVDPYIAAYFGYLMIYDYY